jgi:hypothetical protein
MDTYNIEILKKDIITAIALINNVKTLSIKPREKTLQSFLRGTKSSPFYNSFFVFYPEVSGKYPQIRIGELEEILSIMFKEGSIKLVGKDLVLTKKVELEKIDTDSPYLFHQSAKEYSKEYLYQMTDWSKGHNTDQIKGTVQTKDGWDFPCDSHEEIKFLKHLNKTTEYQAIRGQSFYIEYKSRRAKKKISKYYPDIFMLTNENHIVIIEVKPLAQMSNYRVIDKYRALKKYSEENGYLCAMMDHRFQTFESLLTRKVSKKVEQEFLEILNTKQYYTDDEFNETVRGLSKQTKETRRIDITALIIQKRYVNLSKYGFQINLKNKYKIVNK